MASLFLASHRSCSRRWSRRSRRRRRTARWMGCSDHSDTGTGWPHIPSWYLQNKAKRQKWVTFALLVCFLPLYCLNWDWLIRIFLGAPLPKPTALIRTSWESQGDCLTTTTESHWVCIKTSTASSWLDGWISNIKGLNTDIKKTHTYCITRKLQRFAWVSAGSTEIFTGQRFVQLCQELEGSCRSACAAECKALRCKPGPRWIVIVIQLDGGRGSLERTH